MTVLDIDMDYFLDEIPYNNFTEDRLSSNDYKIWRKEEFVYFIENALGLNKNSKIRGRIITHHHEAFYYWRDAIKSKIISYPFKLIHIDAHADLSYLPDGSWKYITEKYLKKNYNERIFPELLNDFGKCANFDCGNYLLYALACGWLSEMDYVIHPKLEELDFPPHLAKFLELNKFVLTIGNKNNGCPQLNINIVRKDVLNIAKNIDLIIVSRSPQYTPKETDELVEIISQYIELE